MQEHLEYWSRLVSRSPGLSNFQQVHFFYF